MNFACKWRSFLCTKLWGKTHRKIQGVLFCFILNLVDLKTTKDILIYGAHVFCLKMVALFWRDVSLSKKTHTALLGVPGWVPSTQVRWLTTLVTPAAGTLMPFCSRGKNCTDCTYLYTDTHKWVKVNKPCLKNWLS